MSKLVKIRRFVNDKFFLDYATLCVLDYVFYCYEM